MRRVGLLLGFSTAALALLTVGSVSAQTADAASQVAQLLNHSRAASGLAPLTVTSDLNAMAEERAATMAAQRRIFHQSLSNVAGWHVGENVGVSGTIAGLHQMLLDSPLHRDNILGDYTEVGIGAVWVEGSAFVVQLFRLPYPPGTHAAPGYDEATPSPKPAKPGSDIGSLPVPQPEPDAAPAPEPIPAVEDAAPAPAPGPTPALPVAYTAATAPIVERAADIARAPVAVAMLLINGLLVAHGIEEIRTRRASAFGTQTGTSVPVR